MSCEICELGPGKFIPVKNIHNPTCLNCGRSLLSHEQTVDVKWDIYFHSICKAVSLKSSCLSRQIGAILVKDYSIVSTGYNGPPRGVPHCGHERFMKDEALSDEFFDYEGSTEMIKGTCPRRLMNIPSGEGMEWCPAQHAEENTVSNAARLGVSVLGSILYMNSVLPCQKCFGTLINAGIKEIVVEKKDIYDKHTQFLINNSNILIREFVL